jgi:hypothetical protein
LARFIDGSWASIGQDADGYRDGLTSQAQFFFPEGLAVYQGDVYVADRGNHRIRKITRVAGTKDFQVSSVIGTGIGLPGVPNTIQPRATASFSWPTQIAIDGLGNLYIADGGVSSVFKTSLVQQNDVTLVGRPLNSWPTSMTVDRDNTIYVATEKTGLFQVKNNVMSYLGGAGYGNTQEGGSTSGFGTPKGLSVDLKGYLIVADRDNQKVKKILLDLNSPQGLNIYSSKTLSTYMLLPQDSKPVFQGLSQVEDKSLEDELIKNNKAGLISRIYQSFNKQIPERSVVGLPLCQVTIEKTINFDWGYNPLSTSNGCGKDYFLVTYKGFITWPGKGMQPRVFYASVDDGMLLKINNETVIDKWTDGGSIGNYPFNKSGVATLEGGKQYSIEIWYCHYYNYY